MNPKKKDGYSSKRHYLAIGITYSRRMTRPSAIFASASISFFHHLYAGLAPHCHFIVDRWGNYHGYPRVDSTIKVALDLLLWAGTQHHGLV
jgi:hypothetical protein